MLTAWTVGRDVLRFCSNKKGKKGEREKEKKYTAIDVNFLKGNIRLLS